MRDAFKTDTIKLEESLVSWAKKTKVVLIRQFMGNIIKSVAPARSLGFWILIGKYLRWYILLISS